MAYTYDGIPRTRYCVIYLDVCAMHDGMRHRDGFLKDASGEIRILLYTDARRPF